MGPKRLRIGANLLATLGCALLVLACPSSTPTPAAGASTFCNALMGGGVVMLGATFNATGLRVSIQSPPDIYPSVVFFAALPGTSLQAITYDETNGTAATTLVMEAQTGGVTWFQASAADAETGTFSLTITDAGQAVAVDGGTSWPAPQGCLSVTLLPEGNLTDAGLGLVVNAPPSTSFCPCPF
jgi:hypothetical protein